MVRNCRKQENSNILLFVVRTMASFYDKHGKRDRIVSVTSRCAPPSFTEVIHDSLCLLIVCVQRVVGGKVETAALFALKGPAGDEIAHVNHVT